MNKLAQDMFKLISNSIENTEKLCDIRLSECQSLMAVCTEGKIVMTTKVSYFNLTCVYGKEDYTIFAHEDDLKLSRGVLSGFGVIYETKN